MSDKDQLPLFEAETPPGDESVLELKPDMPLKDSITIYLDALMLGGFSPYTIKAFRSDIGLLAKWLGKETAINAIGTADLSKFLHWMQHERGVPCSPKTYARRVTALKNFFGYLHEMKAISSDPSTAIIQMSVGSPLPDVPTDEEIERVLEATLEIRHNLEKPDARPHLLVNLLLQTGIKKSECMGIRLTDIDRSDSTATILWIRYTNPRMRYKERKIVFGREWLAVLDEYLAQRRPRDTLFDCTARNLEYVLRDIADAANVQRQKLSFETLRWTSALKDYRAKMDPDKLRQKLGLSRVAWRETSNKLEQLVKITEPPKTRDAG
ncbi:MAG: site-specific integrase [Anaerolineae bacterium]|nr:site-specific integrase [Anaerolineae bacterium]